MNALFRGHERPGLAQSFVSATGARILLADCSKRRDLTRELGPLLRAKHRFGCARVYVVAPGRSAKR